MLPRGKRLSRDAFAATARGKRAISAHFSITTTLSEHGRAAVVISKKVAKSSVDRHRLKRQIVEILHPYVVPGRSCIIYARAGSTALSYQQLHTEITTLLDSLPAV